MKNRSVIHIHGPDSEKFLQGQTTNDIIKNVYSYNFILNNQGRYLFDFFVFRKSDSDFFIDINSESAPQFVNRLTMYKLRSNLEIDDVSDQYKVIYSESIIKNAISSFKDTRYSKLSFRSIVPSIAPVSDELLSEHAGSDDLYLQDKYDNLIIDGHRDMIYEKSIPIEYGADELNAINYQKGCYIGQEVISRAKYQGVVRKKIYGLIFDQNVEFLEKNMNVLDSDGNKLGIICSSYKKIALALLREEKYLGLEKKTAIINSVQAEIIEPAWRA